MLLVVIVQSPLTSAWVDAIVVPSSLRSIGPLAIVLPENVAGLLVSVAPDVGLEISVVVAYAEADGKRIAHNKTGIRYSFFTDTFWSTLAVHWVMFEEILRLAEILHFVQNDGASFRMTMEMCNV